MENKKIKKTYKRELVKTIVIKPGGLINLINKCRKCIELNLDGFVEINGLTCKKKNYNIGKIKMSHWDNGFPKGLILKRDLTTRECRFLLRKYLGVDLSSSEDFEHKYLEKYFNETLTKDINLWLRGEVDDDDIACYANECKDEIMSVMVILPIIEYLKRKKII